MREIKIAIEKGEGDMCNNIIKRKGRISIIIAVLVLVTGCSFSSVNHKETIHIAAASSMEECLEERLIPLFQSKNRKVSIVGMYDSSGKLQTQIEEGAKIDIFISAAEKQMSELEKKGFVNENYISRFIKNKIVFIVPASEENQYKKFEDIALIEDVAIGDPDSVPAGFYAKEALTNLGIWEEVEMNASFGTNVTEVLNWVAEGSVKAGIVYVTDAAKTEEVVQVAVAPDYCVEEIIYPIGVMTQSVHKEAAEKFVEFLKSDKARNILEEDGFHFTE